MKRIGVSNSCSCVKIDLSSGNEFYAVDIFPEDEVKALMAYFISESQRVGCQLNREFLQMMFLRNVLRQPSSHDVTTHQLLQLELWGSKWKASSQLHNLSVLMPMA